MLRLALAALCGLSVIVLAAVAGAEPLPLSAKRVFLNPEARDQLTVGALAWRGGLQLSSDDRRFGGLSGLLVAPDGRRFTAVSDGGHWITAGLDYDGAGWLAGVGDGRIARLIGPDGRPLGSKHHHDAESLAALADGSLLVGFEQRHRVLRYPAGASPLTRAPVELPRPSLLADAPTNSGLEALVALDGGRVLAITEGLKRDDGLAAFLIDGRRWSTLGYRAPRGFRPTGATRLPDGRILVLERRFTLIGGVACRLALLDPADVRPGRLLSGREIAVLRPPLTVDNMEGVAARRGPAGETLIYLLSDDNFNGLQRTLLLMFAL